MKNLDNLTPEEMRTMLKNIDEILDRHYPDLSIHEQDSLHCELIGLEFFEDENQGRKKILN